MKEGRRLSERRKLNEATFAFELLKRKIGYPLQSHLSGEQILHTQHGVRVLGPYGAVFLLGGNE